MVSISEVEPFLRTIADDPANDTPRLIFADWLEERGLGEYGEFIRLGLEIHRRDIECQMADLSFDHRQRELKPLRERQMSLWNRERYFAEGVGFVWSLDPKPVNFASPHDGSSRRAHFYRGFLSHVYCDPLEWKAWGPKMCELNPVDTIRLSRFAPFQMTQPPARRRFHESPFGWRLFCPGWDIGQSPMGSEILGVMADPTLPGYTMPFLSRLAAVNWLCERLLEWARAKTRLAVPA